MADLMDRQLFNKLCTLAQDCAQFACDNQKKIHVSFKDDGSVLTETDLAVSKRLVGAVSDLFPGCNIVSEEAPAHNLTWDSPWTFVIDPIDGTDAYCQGMDSWCVSVGILDRDLKPCGGIICAPHFGRSSEGITVTTLPGEDEVYLNGELLNSPLHKEIPAQLTMGSDTLKHIDMSQYKGKLRAFGSSILHLLSPCMFSRIDGCIDPVCYAWDTASAHAVVLKQGMVFVYTDGSPVHYTPQMLAGKKAHPMDMFAGPRSCANWMLEHLPPL